MTNVRYEDEKGTDEIRVYSLDGTDALDGSDDDGGEDFDEEDDDGEENYEEEKGNSKDGEIGIYSVDGTQLHLAAAPRVTRGQHTLHVIVTLRILQEENSSVQLSSMAL